MDFTDLKVMDGHVSDAISVACFLLFSFSLYNLSLFFPLFCCIIYLWFWFICSFYISSCKTFQKKKRTYKLWKSN